MRDNSHDLWTSFAGSSVGTYGYAWKCCGAFRIASATAGKGLHAMARPVLISSFLLACLTVSADQIPGKVATVISGHLFDVTCGSRNIRVRLEGIDCPLIPSEEGNRAKQFATELTLGKDVSIVMDSSQGYKINKGYVVLGDLTLEDGSSLSQKLLAQGQAKLGRTKAPDVSLYADLEKQAREARKGLWSTMQEPVKAPSHTESEVQMHVDGATTVEVTVKDDGHKALKIKSNQIVDVAQRKAEFAERARQEAQIQLERQRLQAEMAQRQEEMAVRREAIEAPLRAQRERDMLHIQQMNWNAYVQRSALQLEQQRMNNLERMTNYMVSR